jgi:hypothetical protein
LEDQLEAKLEAKLEMALETLEALSVEHWEDRLGGLLEG